MSINEYKNKAVMFSSKVIILENVVGFSIAVYISMLSGGIHVGLA